MFSKFNLVLLVVLTLSLSLTLLKAQVITRCYFRAEELVPCFSKPEQNSSEACCSALSLAISTGHQCLCSILSSTGLQFMASTSPLLASSLDLAFLGCHLTSPSLSVCQEFQINSSSPVAAPDAGIVSNLTVKEQPNSSMNLAPHLVSMFCMESKAQSSNSCTSELSNLVPCLNYITGNETKPSSSCCTPLASVVQSQPQCLCLLLNGSFSSSGLTINQTRALGLPGLCNVQTPSVSLCNTSGGPSSSPNTPSTPTGGGGTNRVPSDGSWNQAPLTLIFSLFLIAVYYSTPFF
ncbi:hypothetical protein J5N97_016063 [Dioscorea zingiberensis]|uniref:Bifunctional inhibitor/plant lipid transfer protein/seed storage helical domain-containing protein n=1 Tax=Dioscorea zingiberensis TaxID=325984 RepID=A0A9D5CIP6_9LILI|nr:hypothetical protein J5N97_016063 [Dioscorea zingiberensis]